MRAPGTEPTETPPPLPLQGAAVRAPVARAASSASSPGAPEAGPLVRAVGASSSTAGHTSGAADPLIDSPMQRLRYAAGALALGWVVPIVGLFALLRSDDGRIASTMQLRVSGPTLLRATALAWIFQVLVFIGVLAATRRPRPEQQLARIALVFGVVTAFGLSLVESCLGLSYPFLMRQPLAGPWIVFFPLLVPGPPRETVAAVVLSLAWLPLVQLPWWFGEGLPDVPQLLLFAGPPVVLAMLGIGPSLMLHRIRRDLARAERRLERLGSYTLVEKLGEGGMGEVWRAEHQLLARPAAIKLIRPDYLGSDPVRQQQALARFRREAQATAGLESEHTVALYDYGVTDDGRLFYVMELLDGLDLGALVQQEGPQPAERVVHLLRQCCASLEEAHSHGLVHRDIKPANLYLCRRGLRHDVIKVLDFGLVEREAHEPLEGAGRVVGTVAFMAPESTVGSPQDRRSDLYALGCVAWYLLTGETLFTGADVHTVMRKQLHQPPDFARLRAQGVPQSLVGLLSRVLAKDPRHRPQDAGRLDAALAGLGLPGWSEARARHAWQNRQAASAARADGVPPTQPLPAP